MAGTTGLLKSAASAKKKIQAQQDALVAFDWENSAQTYEDFQEYSKYLQDRADATTDASQALTINKTITSARKSYVSNELQRQSMAVAEGRATTTDKLNSVYNFYQQAVDNGDMNLAQNLASQYDSLTVQIQNEALAAQNAASTLALNGVKTLDQLITKATKGDLTGDGLIQLPNGEVIKSIATLNDEFKSDTVTQDYFGEVYRTIQALQQTVADAYTGAQTQDVTDSIESKFGDIITGEKKFNVGGMQLTPQEVELAYRSALANNPLYSIADIRNATTGALEHKLTKNKVDGFTWIRNDDGTYQAIEEQAKITSPYQNLNTKITNEGYLVGDTGKSGVGVIGTGDKIKSSSAASIEDRLLANGITVVKDSNGTPVNENGKVTLALPNGEVVQAVIQPDGSVRYFGKPGDYSNGQAGMYEINILNGQTREVAPDESSIFGQQSIFGGQISKASDAGMNIIKGLTGVYKPPETLLSPHALITNISNDFSGVSVPVITKNLQGTPSSILQSAAQVQQQMRQQLQPAPSFSLQGGPIPNLNQTPVQQFAQNGAPIKQLTVSAPAPAPKLSVTTPTAAPKLTVTSGNSGGLSLAPAPSLPKLTVR